MNKVLVTGAAGFIGFHVAKDLLDKGWEVVGLDNFNDYYDVSLKRSRIAQLAPYKNFVNHEIALEDKAAMQALFQESNFTHVVNMAAQAGVRYSIENPDVYIQSNVVGFLNVLECSRHFKIEHLVFASSSSVYGLNRKMPFSENDGTDHPISLYAATKKSNEMMAHTYASLYGIPCTGLRFFTVYGPWGRPDMAPILFAKAIAEDREIKIFNNGKLRRDFTYVDDIVQGVVATLVRDPQATEVREGENLEPSRSSAPFQIFNIGNNKPVELMTFISTLEQAMGKAAKKKFLPMQPGDVLETYANIDALSSAVGFAPKTDITAGVAKFVEWFREYYG